MTSRGQRSNWPVRMKSENPNPIGTLHDGECFLNIISLIKFSRKTSCSGAKIDRKAKFLPLVSRESLNQCRRYWCHLKARKELFQMHSRTCAWQVHTIGYRPENITFGYLARVAGPCCKCHVRRLLGL